MKFGIRKTTTKGNVLGRDNSSDKILSVSSLNFNYKDVACM